MKVMNVMRMLLAWILLATTVVDVSVDSQEMDSFVLVPLFHTSISHSFTLNHSLDIDECATVTNDCDNLTTTCENTVGSYICTCLLGYEETTISTSCQGCISTMIADRSYHSHFT